MISLHSRLTRSDTVTRTHHQHTNQPTNLTTNNPVPVTFTTRNERCMELLLATRADVNQGLNDGTTPLCIAAQNGHTRCVELLLGAGALPNLADEVTPEGILTSTVGSTALLSVTPSLGPKRRMVSRLSSSRRRTAIQSAHA